MSVVDRIAKARLLPHERAWLSQIFEAILPGETAGLPTFDTIDTSEFFRLIEDAPGPSFLPGLRVMLHGLSVLPLGYAGYRRPFFTLSRDARRAFLAELAQEDGYLSRQLIATMKILAGFAYFEDPAVRARFDMSDFSGALGRTIAVGPGGTVKR